MKIIIKLLLLNLFPLIAFTQASQPNIIFVVVDDCNDWIEGFNGHPQTITPNFAELESKGTTFINAYASAPQCGPSRTSFLSGKDLAYTKVFDNTTYNCNSFAGNFTSADGNEEYFTMPGYLKNSGGYYTYSIGKIFHCYDNYLEYDSITSDECSKSMSWNKVFYHEDSSDMNAILLAADDGIDPLKWGHFDSIYEQYLEDYVSTDTAIAFLNAVAADASVTCNKPFFLGFGIRKPHFPSIVSEEYFLPYYLDDIYELPYRIPYNYPEGSTPYNGVVLPQETTPRFSEYLDFMPGGIALQLAGNTDANFTSFLGTLGGDIPSVKPIISPTERNLILEKSQRANLIMGYLANIRFADTQFGRFMDALESHPDIYNNTIIVLIGDHGFSLGEHRHWQKQALWETDVRAPFIIADLRSPSAKIEKRMCSFLDIFPTVCDYAGIELPQFSDGSPYLDGKSLFPLMESELPLNERPVLSTIKNSQGKNASCYPQYSVRNNRFHFIRYTWDNADGNVMLGCDSTGAPVEEELYELGEDRDIDPNEFHNLIHDPDYKPLRDYLNQFTPDGDMYLQTPMKAQINLQGVVPCFYSYDDLISLKVFLYDEEGYEIPAVEYLDYTITWTNNLTADTGTGKEFDFHVNDIPIAEFDTISRIMFYVSVKNADGKQIAFDIKYAMINEDNEPVADYSTNIYKTRVKITAYSVDGEFYKSLWDFGDGYTSTLVKPGPHIYSLSGTRTIRNTLYYGNGCEAYFDKLVSIFDPTTKLGEISMNIFPNPASNYISISTDNVITGAHIFIYNTLGQIVLEQSADELEKNTFTEVYITTLKKGIYFLKIEGENAVVQQAFEVM